MPDYKMTKTGKKEIYNGEYICINSGCQMKIDVKQDLPYCYMCEDKIINLLKKEYNEGLTIGCLSQKFNIGYVKIRKILNLKRGEGIVEKTNYKPKIVSIIKEYKDYLNDSIIKKDSLAFLKSKIK